MHLIANKPGHSRVLLIEPTNLPAIGDTMTAFILERLGSLLERSEHNRRDTFLASSADLAELERRMRFLETNGFPVEPRFGLNA
jgi:Protein of unknown function (DUF3563)